jgi:glycosyltransferase involved in cell wall biosynthesis
MKIVHLTWGLGVGGAETMLADIAIEQAVAHEIWVVVVNRDVDASIALGAAPSLRWVTLNRPPGSSNPWYLLKLILWLWWVNPDVVHAHQESFIRLRKLIRVPMVLTVHSTRSPLSDRLAAFDSVCCISEAVRDDVLSRFPDCRPRIVSNGIDFRAVKPRVQYGSIPFRIVQVSRLAHEIKGQDLLIRALRLVLDRLGDNSVSVDFIGGGNSLQYLRQLAVECGVDGRCQFLGAATRQFIYDALREYDLLAQPSRYEGFGLTVVEGIAAGLPVLVSDIEGPMEIIAGGELGWSFKSEDAQDLASKLLELIALSREPGFGDRMRTRVEVAQGRFDIRLTARRYVDEYSRLAPAARPVQLSA